MDIAYRRAVAEARRHGDLYFAGLFSEDRIKTEKRGRSGCVENLNNHKNHDVVGEDE